MIEDLDAARGPGPSPAIPPYWALPAAPGPLAGHLIAGPGDEEEDEEEPGDEEEDLEGDEEDDLDADEDDFDDDEEDDEEVGEEVEEDEEA